MRESFKCIYKRKQNSGKCYALGKTIDCKIFSKKIKSKCPNERTSPCTDYRQFYRQRISLLFNNYYYYPHFTGEGTESQVIHPGLQNCLNNGVPG